MGIGVISTKREAAKLNMSLSVMNGKVKAPTLIYALPSPSCSCVLIDSFYLILIWRGLVWWHGMQQQAADLARHILHERRRQCEQKLLAIAVAPDIVPLKPSMFFIVFNCIHFNFNSPPTLILMDKIYTIVMCCFLCLFLHLLSSSNCFNYSCIPYFSFT